ncbi:MAG: DUF4097 family beta strand repeat-containing protein [Treponema sp.]|nr:DUF4097 family beta strand repeat-containing protein [Treponema sp.]
MTKRQYLKRLELAIAALPYEEQQEALDYYESYFDDAESVTKAMKDLGEPEDLAKEIIKKFSCVPAKAKQSKNKNSDTTQEDDFDEQTESTGVFEEERLSYTFKNSGIKNLGISAGACRVFIKSGSEYKVEAKGLEPHELRCEVLANGSLVIENRTTLSASKFTSHNRNMELCPRILITIPAKTNLECFKLQMNAGELKSRDISINCQRASISVHAGNCEIAGLYSQNSEIRAGMGKLDIHGRVEGYSKIDCTMGNINIFCQDANKDYSFDSKIRMGNIVFGDQTRGGLSDKYNGPSLMNHCSINCTMGDVKITFSGR